MSDSLVVICSVCQAGNRVPVIRLSEQAKCGKCSKALLSGVPIDVNEVSLARHISGDLPVVIDFWAPWCGPCQSMAPAYKQAAQQMAKKAQFLKLDTEQHQAVGQRYQIRSIPTLMCYKNGQLLGQQAGSLSAPALQQWVSSLIE